MRPEKLHQVDLVDILRSGQEELQGDLDAPLRRMTQNMKSRTSFQDLVVPIRLREEQKWISFTGKPVHDDEGQFQGFRGVGSDITAQRKAEAEIAFLARYDSLTNLANRSTFP